MTQHSPACAEAGPRLEVAAAALVRARLEGNRLASLPGSNLPVDLAEGFAIQQHVGKLAGKTAGGWKCALPPAGKWIVAPIYSDSIVRGEQYRVAADAGKARVEPELACLLAHDLPARAEPYTAAHIIAAISNVHLALEVIDCRYTDPHALPFEQLLADGLFNHGLVLGSPITLSNGASMPAELDITLSDASATLLTIKGRHPDVDPVLPIVWLANFLSAQGIGLHAGQVVITGSYAGVLDVPLDQPMQVRFGDAGVMRVCFSTLEKK